MWIKLTGTTLFFSFKISEHKTGGAKLDNTHSQLFCCCRKKEKRQENGDQQKNLWTKSKRWKKNN